MPRKFLSGLDLSGERLTSLGEPTSGTDAATKDYVDANAGGSSWQGLWDDVTEYNPGDIVEYNNELWIANAVTPNVDSPPDQYANWYRVNNFTLVAPWDITADYASGDIVIHDNAFWACFVPNVGNEPVYPVDIFGVDPVYWYPFGAPNSALGGGGDGVGNSASNVEIIYREATFYDTAGPLTYSGTLPPGHYYTLTAADLGKFIIVYRGFPTDTIDDPAATTVGIIAPQDIGVVGDRVEVMVLEAQDFSTSLGGTELITASIIVSGLATLDVEDELASLSVAIGDFWRPTQLDTKETIWYAETRGKFTKFLDDEYDLGVLPAPIPVAAWLFEGAMIRGDAV